VGLIIPTQLVIGITSASLPFPDSPLLGRTVKLSGSSIGGRRLGVLSYLKQPMKAKKVRAAGLSLLPGHTLWFIVREYEDLVHGNLQQYAEGNEIINRRQALPVLPLVNCLGFLKTIPGLDVPDTQALRLSKPCDVPTGLCQINNRKFANCHLYRLLWAAKLC
jgi:hypothetical protein